MFLYNRILMKTPLTIVFQDLRYSLELYSLALNLSSFQTALLASLGPQSLTLVTKFLLFKYPYYPSNQ